ncbi:MAG TPA: 16S rRNA processing protein RimM [Firmicutes bacterium]|nr:16S rRNA processing protein RimM [Bacillota bacterium]
MGRPVRFVAIGEVASPCGLRGEVHVVPLTDFPERFRSTRQVLLGKPGEEPAGPPVKVERVRLQGRGVVVKLAGVDSPEAARLLRGRLLFVPREEVAPLPEGRFYVFDLVGLTVFDEAGRVLGELVEVLDRPANDVFVVRPTDGGPGILVPALKSVVRQVDLAEGRMVVRLLPGLADDEDEGSRP